MRDTATYKKVLHAEILFAMATTEGVGPSPRLSLLSEAVELVGGKRYPAAQIKAGPAKRSPNWATPGDIGKDLGIPAGTVGRCLKLAGLHGTQDKSRAWSKTNGVHGSATKQYLYDHAVVSAVVASVHSKKEIFEVVATCAASRKERN